MLITMMSNVFQNNTQSSNTPNNPNNPQDQTINIENAETFLTNMTHTPPSTNFQYQGINKPLLIVNTVNIQS